MTESPFRPLAAAPGSADAPKRNRREETKEANRQAILEAARKVFVELGYGATTVRDIVRRTDLASGTFYNYFKSKEEVFEALMDESALAIRPRLRQVRAEAATFEEFVERTFLTFFTHVVEDRPAYEMMRANSGHMRVRMDTPEVIAGFEELQADIERAMELGLAPAADPEFLSAALIGIAFEMGDRLVLRPEPDPAAAARFATGLVLGGIGAPDVAR